METVKTITATANGASSTVALEAGDWNVTIESSGWGGASADLQVADPGLTNWKSLETFTEDQKRFVLGNNDFRLNVADFDSANIVAKFRKRDAVIDLLSSGTVTQLAPVDVNGNVIGPLVIGDDYTGSRQFQWRIPPDSFDIANATCRFGGKGAFIENAESEWLVEGTVTLDSGDWLLAVDLPAADNDSLLPGNYEYSAALIGPSTQQRTIAFGTVAWRRSYTPPLPP